MYSVKFFVNDKKVLDKLFPTLQEAEDFLLETPDYSCEYQIYDDTKQELIDEGELESNDDIIDGTLDMMNPNDDE